MHREQLGSFPDWESKVLLQLLVEDEKKKEAVGALHPLRQENSLTLKFFIEFNRRII